jgi:hypothetical protein
MTLEGGDHKSVPTVVLDIQIFSPVKAANCPGLRSHHTQNCQSSLKQKEQPIQSNFLLLFHLLRRHKTQI